MVLATLIVVNVLQYAPLIAFVSFQSFTKTNTARYELMVASRMTKAETIALVFWPELSGFSAFVGAVIFTASFGESEKALLFFRASTGTDSSLVAHLITDTYRRLHVVQDVALLHIFSTSAVAIVFSIFAIASAIGLGMLLCRAALQLISSRFLAPYPSNQATLPNSIYRRIAAAALLALVICCSWSALGSDGLVVKDIFIVLVAALAASVLYIAYTFAFRLSGAHLWNVNAGMSRWLFSFILLSIRLIPGTVLFYLIVTWTVPIGRQSVAIQWIAWFATHLLYNSAIVLPFLLLLLQRVPSTEIELLKASRVGSLDISRVSLLLRFWRELVVVFVFVFVLVWNGDAANGAMSTIFRSANMEIITNLHGRKYDLLRSVELALPTLSLAILSVSLLAYQAMPSDSQVDRQEHRPQFTAAEAQ
ncbi:hypothetical protein [Bradyrhizobium sp. SZCCHNRI1009]|uniref:hypothetical protein n=1 Tax=Bradyrhizobium sp. SZCCHNRI1009 TaxID=3057277 RepID=UPI002916435B|nr:hypothetical protein [Bradyrhizobium sp. SZCCHNRI1009]